VGDWRVLSEDDAFDKGGTYTMFTGIDSFIFGVRCSQKTPNFAILLPDDKLTAGQTFTVKLRVDHGDIVEVGGIALGDH
jgi:hypothetical protein